MKGVLNTSPIFTATILTIEAAQRRRCAGSRRMRCSSSVADCLVDGDEEETQKVVAEVLRHRDPLEIINRSLIPGMKEVSRLWDLGEYFLPQVILSSDAMIAGIALCEEKMGRTMEKKAKVVTHTAEGDIHDIGQVIVNALLRVAGFDVINLGADVPVDDVVEACRIHKPIMVTGTALMTTTMTAFPRIAARLKQAGTGDSVCLRRRRGQRGLRDQLRSRHLGQGSQPGFGHGRGRAQRPQLVGDAGQVERVMHGRERR